MHSPVLCGCGCRLFGEFCCCKEKTAYERRIMDWSSDVCSSDLHMMEWFRPEGVDVRGTLRGADLAALGIPTAEDYARRYCERTGLRCDPTHPFYRAFNLFRVAAILQGIAGRAIGRASCRERVGQYV